MGPSWCRPSSLQPFAFLLGLLVLPCCHAEHPAGGSRGGLLVLFPPRHPPAAQTLFHPMAGAPAPPRAHPCQNTSPVPEPKAVGAATPSARLGWWCRVGTEGTPRLGASGSGGPGPWQGMAWPGRAACGDTGVCTMAGPWGWSTAAPGCASGSCHPQGARRGENWGPASPPMSPDPPALQCQPWGSPFIAILGGPGQGSSCVHTQGVSTALQGADPSLGTLSWVLILLPLTRSWALAPTGVVSPHRPPHPLMNRFISLRLFSPEW